MKEVTKKQTLYWSWNIAALICLVIVVIAYQPTRAEELTRDDAFYGDVFKLNQVRDFKEPLSLDTTKGKSSLRNAELIAIGDSFLNAAMDSPKFPYLLEQTSGVPTWYVKQTPKYTIAPSAFFKDEKVPNAKVVLWEQVERNIVFLYLQSKPSAIRDIESAIPERIKQTSAYRSYVAAKNKVFNIEPVLFFTSHNRYTEPLFEQLATVRFKITGDISPRTPEYALDPLMGFYDAELEFAREPLTDADIEAIAGRTAAEIKKIEREQGVKVIYLPLPSKYTVYRSLIKNQEYNELLPRLIPLLKAQDVAVVDVLPLYQQRVEEGGELLYYASDTHWTGAAKTIAAQEVLEFLQE